MADFFQEYDQKFNKQRVEENAEAILQELCFQINERFKDDKIFALLTTTSGDYKSFITYAIQLSIPEANRYYSYRYIEVEQPVDKYFPITISAFQHPPTEPKKIGGPQELRDELVSIVGNVRTRIVLEHLKQVATFDNNL